MQNINEIEELIKLISKLPGLGPKSAKRIVLKLINNRDEIVKPMINSLTQVYKNIVRCKTCGTLKSNPIGCNNCENITEKYNIFVLLRILQINGLLKILIFIKVIFIFLEVPFLRSVKEKKIC